MKLKILMLGWEFPPLISGGLGVACKGIADALSDYTDLTIVVPKAIIKSENPYTIMGINQMNQKDNGYKVYTAGYTQESTQNYLTPYYTDQAFQKINVTESEYRLHSENDNLWKNNNTLYGPNIHRKIHEYSASVFEICKNIQFDIIHAHDWMTMVAGISLKKKLSKPLVLHVHSLETDRSGENNNNWIFKLEKEGMESADLILAVSHYTKNKIVNQYKIPSSKINVVHNGNSSIPELNKKEERYNETKVAFIGRLTRQKGAEYFVDIAEKVIKRKKNFRFIIAGTGENLEQLVYSTAMKSIGDRVHFTGFLNNKEIHQLLSSTDIYCMPSVSEPFGLSAVEAASYNIPCILSKQSGVIEVLKNSIQFDFWDINKAAGAIINLSENKMLTKEMTKNARRELRQVNWKNTATEILKYYNYHRLIKN